ncbi:MAG TPA: NAD-dependent DNA ligase LigA, partial [Candidatus Absconditabacterales bacterium]|nr:NAD-dependent DNA ligase LigA [Candidatus Absconditabacterales bacterium]
MNLSEKTQKLQNYIKSNQNISNISQSDIQKIYQELIDCIIDHNHLYYIESDPIISDVEYDQLFDYLKKIEQSFPYIISGDSPTQKLVNQIQDDFKKANHKMPMLSLENSYNSEDLIERERRILRILEKAGITQKPTYYIEPKFDGISIELIYENGIFKQAITRGDGITGEDVTQNVKTIKNIPSKLNKKINGEISFRGEILISKSELKKINQQREIEGLQVYANTRNLASGSLKQLNTNITASRNLQCFSYDILHKSVISTEMSNNEGSGEISLNKKKDFSQDMILEMTLQGLGLPTYPNINSSQNIENIIEICENKKTKENLQKEDIDFDGLVIKVKENELRTIIGSTVHHPRRAIAYKFPAEQVSTQIKSIEFQVGRTGIITPVAKLEPVKLSGATISSVSLHNFDFIKEKDIHQDDFVRLQRSGEVIPYITGVIKDRRKNVPLNKGEGKGDNKKKIGKISPPTHCPSCGTKLTHIDMHYYCQNPSCPAQVKEKIIRFVSKNCMNIEGVGESIVEILVDNNIVSNIADLYKLLDFETERIVRRFPGFADKKITEIKKQLEESKNKEFRRLLNGLGIPGIGKKTAQDISNAITPFMKGGQGDSHLKQISKYLTNPEFLIGIYGIGEKMVEGIIDYRKANLELLKKLEKLGLNFSVEPIHNSQFTIHNSFSITGSFKFPRPKIIEEMEKKGYTFDSNPNKNTNYMLIGSKPGSKLSKAEELGIKIIKGRDNITKQFPFLLDIK